MQNRGETLYRAIFKGSPAGIKLWAAVEPYLPSTRIEITTGIADATAIPWELIRNPSTDTSLALSAQAFVRAQRGARATPAPKQREAEEVRILLVICRPSGRDDVPFHSVAGPLLTRLREEAFDLDVLRPPTYEQLATTLRFAKEAGRPYNIVHFDGHGTYGPLAPGTRPRDLRSRKAVRSQDPTMPDRAHRTRCLRLAGAGSNRCWDAWSRRDALFGLRGDGGTVRIRALWRVGARADAGRGGHKGTEERQRSRNDGSPTKPGRYRTGRCRWSGSRRRFASR